MLGRPGLAEAHQPADGRRRGVQDGDAVAFDALPPAIRIRVGRSALEHEGGRAHEQRAVDDIRVARHPARVRRAPPAVLVVEVENIFEGRVNPNHVTAVRVDNGLGLAGRAGGVQDIKRIFRIQDFGGALAVGDGQDAHFVIPVVAARLHRHLVADPFNNDHVFHRRATLERLVHGAFEFHHLAVVVTAVHGDDQFRLAVFDTAL